MANAAWLALYAIHLCLGASHLVIFNAGAYIAMPPRVAGAWAYR